MLWKCIHKYSHHAARRKQNRYIYDVADIICISCVKAAIEGYSLLCIYESVCTSICMWAIRSLLGSKTPQLYSRTYKTTHAKR